MKKSTLKLNHIACLAATILLPWLVYIQAAEETFQIAEVAPGIYVHLGKHEDPSARNANDISNVGFIVGEESIAVIDPGGSLVIGNRLRQAIKDHSSLPIRYIIITHVHPDHSLGTPKFLDDNPQIIGHHRLPGAMIQRGNFYVERFREILGQDAVSSMIPPTVLVDSETEIDLGNRKLLIQAHATAHTDHDLSVFDYSTKSLWLSDLLFVDRVPVIDGSVISWVRVLNTLQHINAELVIPGHGDVIKNWPAGATPILNYFDSLVQFVRSAIQNGASLSATLDQALSSDPGHWKLYREYHSRNVTRAYSELEWE